MVVLPGCPSRHEPARPQPEGLQIPADIFPNEPARVNDPVGSRRPGRGGLDAAFPSHFLMRSHAELARIRPERPRGRGSLVAQGRLRYWYWQLEARPSTKSESSESARPGRTCWPEAREGPQSRYFSPCQGPDLPLEGRSDSD